MHFTCTCSFSLLLWVSCHVTEPFPVLNVGPPEQLVGKQLRECTSSKFPVCLICNAQTAATMHWQAAALELWVRTSPVKCQKLQCCEKPLEKSGLEPYGTESPAWAIRSTALYRSTAKSTHLSSSTHQDRSTRKTMKIRKSDSGLGWGLCEYMVHTILAGSAVILWISPGGKPKWLPLKFGYHDVMRTSPINILLLSKR